MADDDLIYSKNILRMMQESGSETVFYPLFHEDLPEEYKLIAEQTLGETSANKEKGLRKLKEFMKKENLSCTDDVLITVLRSCKYNVKKSESKLKRFLRSRQTIIQKLCQLDEEKIQFIFDDTVFSVLPYRDKHGRVVIVTKPTVRLGLYSMSDVEAVAMSSFLYLLTYPMTTVCGFSYIGECKCDDFLLLYEVMKNFKSFVYYMLDFPIRMRRVDVTNENFLIRFVFNACRPILPHKISKRVFFCGNSYKDLHKEYHPDTLPQEFEGNMEPINNTLYKERLMKFIQQLKQEGSRADFSVTSIS